MKNVSYINFEGWNLRIILVTIKRKGEKVKDGIKTKN